MEVPDSRAFQMNTLIVVVYLVKYDGQPFEPCQGPGGD